MSKEDKLPNNWVWTTLDELGIVASGGTPSTDESQFWGGDINWITPSDLSNYKGKYITKGKRNITQLGLDYSSAILLPQGSLLFSSRAPIGYIAITQNELATNQGFKNLIPTTFTYINFLYHYLQYAKPLIIDMASGTTFLELSAKAFSKIPVPLAPLNEQYRIVEKIEELFSEIENVEQNLLDVNKRLNIYWQAILDSAFERVQETNEKLISFTTFIGAGSTPKGGRSIYVKSGIPFVRSQNVLHYSLSLEDVAYITDAINENMARTKVQPNDVLLNITGASIGRCAYVPDYFNQGNVNQHVCIIRTTSDLSHKYLALYLNSPKVQRLIKEWSSGATREALTLSQIKDIAIPIRPLSEQELIVAELESQYTILENVKETITKKLRHIKVLKQSILSKAFTGKLVPQNPNDEPASDLLKKIKEERLEFLRNKPILKKVKNKILKMERKKSVLEILQETQDPILAKEVWQQSKHWENIDDFYAELKSISDLIQQTKSKAEILLSLKK